MTVQRKHFIQDLLPRFGELALTELKEHGGIKQDRACLAVDLHIDLVGGKFLVEGCDQIRLDADDLVDPLLLRDHQLIGCIQLVLGLRQF